MLFVKGVDLFAFSVSACPECESMCVHAPFREGANLYSLSACPKQACSVQATRGLEIVCAGAICSHKDSQVQVTLTSVCVWVLRPASF